VSVLRLCPWHPGRAGELERHEDSHRLCYARGPAGIIVEPAERLG